MTPNKMPNTPGDRDAVESPTDECLRVIADICRTHAELTLAQIEAGVTPKIVPIYANRTQINSVDCAKLP